MPMKHNRVQCTDAGMEPAEQSTPPFPMGLARLMSSAEKPETLKLRQMAQRCRCLASDTWIVLCRCFFCRALSFFLLACSVWAIICQNRFWVLSLCIGHLCLQTKILPFSWFELPKAEHTLPLLPVLLKNVLSYLTRKLTSLPLLPLPTFKQRGKENAIALI